MLVADHFNTVFVDIFHLSLHVAYSDIFGGALYTSIGLWVYVASEITLHYQPKSTLYKMTDKQACTCITFAYVLRTHVCDVLVEGTQATPGDAVLDEEVSGPR